MLSEDVTDIRLVVHLTQVGGGVINYLKVVVSMALRLVPGPRLSMRLLCIKLDLSVH